MQGRRLPDTVYGSLPSDLQPGDYWKCMEPDGATPLDARRACNADAGNLSNTVWQFYSPDGNGIGTLINHTVREHDDGTISIRPGDGSSNSVLHSGGASGKSWHGYVDHGDWQEC